MGIFEALFGETNREIAKRWKEELLELLENKFGEDDNLEFVEEDGALFIRKGLTIIGVHFIFEEDENEDAQGHMLINSSLVYLPNKNLLPFYRKLLDLNAELVGSLVTDENIVDLQRISAIGSLSEEGFLSDVSSILNEAEETIEALVEEFQVSRYDPDQD